MVFRLWTLVSQHKQALSGTRLTYLHAHTSLDLPGSGAHTRASCHCRIMSMDGRGGGGRWALGSQLAFFYASGLARQQQRCRAARQQTPLLYWHAATVFCQHKRCAHCLHAAGTFYFLRFRIWVLLPPSLTVWVLLFCLLTSHVLHWLLSLIPLLDLHC